MTIIKGALDMRNKKVSSVMTPLDSVYMLSWQQKLDKDTIRYVSNIYTRDTNNLKIDLRIGSFSDTNLSGHSG